MAEQHTQGPLPAALLAGLGLALADSLASGVLRTPWEIHALGLGMGLGVGLIAGLVAMGVGRQGAGLALVLAFGAGLNSLSIVSKEFAPGAHSNLGAASVVLSVLAGAACLGAGRPLALRFLVLASVPASSLMVGLVGATPLSILGAAALPLLIAALTRIPRLQIGYGRMGVPLSLMTALLLGLPVALKDPAQIRPDLLPNNSTGTVLGPDITLVIIDTMRADAMDESGPLARLADEGVRFEECISSAPWTLPSVSSILTGLLPSQHGAIDATRALPADVQTLAESLRQAGYQTAAFTGGAFVGPTFQLDQGFEHFDATPEFGFRPFQLHVPLAWRLAKNRFFPIWPAIEWVQEYPGFKGVCSAAQDWLEQRDKNRPYFLLLHTYEIHDYYLARAKHELRESEESKKLSQRFRGRLSVHPEELLGASQEDLDHFEGIYKKRLLNVESELDAFLLRLSNTTDRKHVLALISDHGEGFDAARGRVHHGGRLHDDLLRVPFVLHAPGILPAGRLVPEPVSSIDLAPTLLELAGMKPGAELPGQSLLGLISGANKGGRALWSEERANGRSLLSLRAEGWKLMREGDQDQFFELENDPDEDAPGTQAPAHLHAALDGFPQKYPARTAENSEIDAQTEAHLRNIGYLGDQDEDSD